MSTEAVITPIAPEEEARICEIESCDKPAVYTVVKLPEAGAEKERFFCQEHGQEYASRAHLVISENI